MNLWDLLGLRQVLARQMPGSLSARVSQRLGITPFRLRGTPTATTAQTGVPNTPIAPGSPFSYGAPQVDAGTPTVLPKNNTKKTGTVGGTGMNFLGNLAQRRASGQLNY